MSSSLILCSNNEPSLDWIDWDMQWKVCFIQQPATTSNNQLSGWTEKKLQSTFQSQACTKKGGTVTVRWSAAGLTHYNFPNASKLLPKRRMLSKPMRCTENSHSWASTGQQSGPNSATTPNHTLHNQCFKTWMNWPRKFCLICHIHLTSHQLTSTSSSTSTPFFKEKAFTTSRRQKMLSKSSLNPEAQIFMLQK